MIFFREIENKLQQLQLGETSKQGMGIVE